MITRYKFKINSTLEPADLAKIDEAIDTLPGVKDVEISKANNECIVGLDKALISMENVLSKFKEIGYAQVTMVNEASVPVSRQKYYVTGMHCGSCEILIENQVSRLSGVKSVSASTKKNQLLIETENNSLTKNDLNKMFKESGYVFSDQAISAFEPSKDSNGIYKSVVIAGLIIAAFILLNQLGFSSWLNVNSKSSLPAFFFLGIFAGLSTCAALVGGIILSMSKQWLELYKGEESFIYKMQPHLMFNAGRLATYGILGAVLGGIGSTIQVSFAFTSILVIIISLVMLLLALQMLGVKSLQKFQLGLPKFITRKLADETKFSGRYMPAVMGALTFFLPCGFTITAQGLALLSGSALEGGLIMFLFALGTLPMLLAIGISSVKMAAKPGMSATFLKVAGVIVLFFALFNINSQLNVLGLPSFTDALASSNSQTNTNQVKVENDLPPIVDGKQVIKMTASATGYSPNYFIVRSGVPVKWEIYVRSTSGCTDAIISKGLFPEEIKLTPGETVVKEFTQEKPGRYKFSCWMGMVSGVMEVVDSKSVSESSNGGSLSAAAPVPSGARGCGCGGGGSSCSAGNN